MKKPLLLLISFFSYGISMAQQTVGLFTQTPQSQDGYVFFAPMASTTTYLIDKCGYSVHSWPGSNRPGLSAYLLEDGSLLRTGSVGNTVFTAGGSGGLIERIDWNGNVTWSYTLSGLSDCQHHDVCYLPNGNILAIAWDLKQASEAENAGRNPSLSTNDVWSEKIVELHPVGTDSAVIVWQWNAWDHLVQDYDSTKTSYGVVADEPGLININYHMTAGNGDWLHINSVDYNPQFDQILLSCHNFSEVWIIDHSTTTIEAASHAGGNYNKGGDLLYRWGNPASYNNGTTNDKQFFSQHDATWIQQGLSDEGKIMVFNNGVGRPAGNYSSVDIIDPPVDANGNYTYTAGQSFLPASLYWSYTANPTTNFFSNNLSSAQRLANGNTLICEGVKGHFFEVDSSNTIVWDYVNPITASGPITQGNAANQNTVFRCILYQADYAGFSGQTLVSSGTPLENNPISYSCTTTSGINYNSQYEITIQVNNPFSSTIVLHPIENKYYACITLYNVYGKALQTWKNIDLQRGKETNLPVSDNLSNGIYLLSVQGNSGLQNFRLIKAQ